MDFKSYLTLAWLVICCPTGYYGGYSEKKLLRHLFDQSRHDAHNILERPTKNDSEPVEVRMKVYLTQLIDVDEKNQIIHTNIWLDLKWRDYHFSWDPAKYNGVTGFNIPADKVWKPDLLLFNSADDKFDGTYPTNVVVKHSSLMQWVPPGMFKSTCDIDITWFPFDRQQCSLKFGSWTYSGHQIDLRLQCVDDDNSENHGNCTEGGQINLDDFSVNGEFYIINIPIARNQYQYNNATFVHINVTIGIQRKPLYYVFNLIIPCILISTMALLEFTLPPDAGEKISLGVTILLSMTMFLLLVADKLPQTSGAIPLIGIYFACIMIMCSLSIVFTVLVLNYHHRSVNLKPVPNWIKHFINNWLARIVFMDTYEQFVEEKNQMRKESLSARLSENGIAFSMNKQTPNSKYIFSNALDVEEDFRVSGLGYSNTQTKMPSPPTYMNCTSSEHAMVSQFNKKGWQNQCTSKNDMSVIIRELKKITEKIKDDEEEVSMAKEWKFAARVIDRCCLIVFSLFIVISTVTILTRAPKSAKILA